MERWDSLAIDLTRWDLERKASECYKVFVVRSRLKRVPNEDMKCNTFAHEEEVLRFPFRYIELVKSPDGHMLWLNREMHDAFQVHFRDHFAHFLDLPVQEFCSNLADSSFLVGTEAASCEGLVTECEVCTVLKQVGLKKSLGLDGLLYEVYLRKSHVCSYSDG